MNKKIIYIALSVLMLTTYSCDKYLDTMPDSRAEINSVDKVTSLLVDAYPTNNGILIAEMSSDNAIDNGANYSPINQGQEDAYLWKDITTTSNDDPKAIWDAHYGSIAAANQALDAIKEMGNPASMNAQKGEALMCRAFGHFAMSNLFCMAYNPLTADKDMGLPFSEAPETKVIVKYERGTMAQLYSKINADIEAALPLINDEIYSVPKYHFNKKAAYAFAARFNLYYQKFDKAAQYASVALGDYPDKLLGKWKEIYGLASNWQLRADRYISASDPGNFLLSTAYSLAGRTLGPYGSGLRYGNARQIVERETFRVVGPWGPGKANLYPAATMWGYDQKFVIPKMGEYFEYTDKAAGIGYPHIVPVTFTAGETLLCRAEAYILQNKYAEGVSDLNVWIKSNTNLAKTFTQDSLVNYYNKQLYMPIVVKGDTERSIKKKINPQGFTVADGVQENLVQCVLHLRRMETMHQGLRWNDIKRYGIEYAHNRDGETPDELLKDDPRRAVQIPQDVISAGLAGNPRNKK